VNIVVNEFCSKCHALTNMIMTTSERNEQNGEDISFKIITTSYHCNICNTFVRSEDKKMPLNSENT